MPKPLIKYKLPWRKLSSRAQHKAEVFWRVEWNADKTAYWMEPGPGCAVLEFEARSYHEALMIAEDQILPGDPRPIKGRSNIKFFAHGKNHIVCTRNINPNHHFPGANRNKEPQ